MAVASVEKDHSQSTLAADNYVLQAKDLYCERDDRLLFSGLDLTLGAGDFVQLVGPNGAGKTTLLRLLAGLNRDFSGQVRWCGRSIKHHYDEYAKQRLYLGHLSAVKKSADTTGKPGVVFQCLARCEERCLMASLRRSGLKRL